MSLSPKFLLFACTLAGTWSAHAKLYRWTVYSHAAIVKLEDSNICNVKGEGGGMDVGENISLSEPYLRCRVSLAPA